MTDKTENDNSIENGSNDLANEGNGKKNGTKVRMRKVTNKQSEEESDSLVDIMKGQNIDELINYLKDTKLSNNKEILDLNSNFMEQHPKGVEMFLELAVKLEPESSLHHYNYALYLENQKFYKEAKDEFTAAIDLDMENDQYHTDYGNLLLMLNEYEDAEKQYNTALVLNPNNINALTNLGYIYTTNNEHDKAEETLKKAISIEPNSPLSYINLLHLYKRNGKSDEAIAVLRKYKNLKLQDLNVNMLHLD